MPLFGQEYFDEVGQHLQIQEIARRSQPTHGVALETLLQRPPARNEVPIENALHHTGYGESVEFELDTQIPTNNGLQSPANGTIDVVISTTLTAQAAGGDVPPLQYRFLLDDNVAFDDGSSRRQDSGWLTDDLDWTPTALITNTVYWWKVQVRDAYSNTASFSTPYSFTTQSFSWAVT